LTLDALKNERGLLVFGYIRPYKPELKVRELETYRAVYCGLCHSLGKRYSFFMRMILNYDETFLALLQLGLSEGCVGFEKRRCPAKPFGKKSCCKLTGDVEFSADTSVILFYYKLRDNLQDAGLFKRAAAGLLLLFASPKHKKAARRRPQVEALVKSYVAAQREAEKKGSGIDEAAHPTAMMSKLLAIAAGDRANERIVTRMGYFIGRWIYITDAADDIEDDLKSGDYNPFVSVYSLKAGSVLKEAREGIKKLLNSSQYEICAAFELLEIERFKPIISNIFYLGMPETAAAILKGEKIKPI
jgi:hypothetical protein